MSAFVVSTAVNPVDMPMYKDDMDMMSMIPMHQEMDVQGQHHHHHQQQQQQQQQQSASIDPNKFKTKICRNWQQGECMYSERCAFAHGEVDKRRSEMAQSMRKMTPQQQQQPSYEQMYYQQTYNNNGNNSNGADMEMYSAMDNSSYLETSTCDEMMTPQTSIMTPIQTPITKNLFPGNMFPGDDKSQCSSVPSFPVYRYEPYGSDQVSQVPVDSFCCEVVSSDEANSDNEHSVSSTDAAVTPTPEDDDQH